MTDTKETQTDMNTNTHEEVRQIGITGGFLPDYNRDERLTLIEVDVPDCALLPLASGHLVPIGKSRVLVRDVDLPAIRALVRTEEQAKNLEFAAAQLFRDQASEWQRRLDAWLAGGSSADSSDPDFRRFKNEHEQTRTGSVSGTYNKLFSGECPPIRSMKIIETGIVNPRDVERLRAEQEHSKALADAVGGASGASSTDQSAAIAAAVASALAKTLHEFGIVQPTAAKAAK